MNMSARAPAAETPLVTISLTSIGSRLPKIADTLRSLLAQDYPEIELRLYLSHEPFLLDPGLPDIAPPHLRALELEDPRFSVRFTTNIGPYRKILPALREARGRRRLIATADDDTIYPPGWLSGLVSAWRTHRCVVCYRGHHMRRKGRKFVNYRGWMVSELVRNPDIYNLPTGKDGVLYDTSFFHPNVIDHGRALAIAPTADDLWLKWHYSALDDVPTFVINPDYRSQTFKGDPFGASLYENYNRDGGNDATVARLERYAAASGRTPLAARL